MAEGAVHQDDPQTDEDEVRQEPKAVCKGASHQRGRNDGEHSLVAGECEAWDVAHDRVTSTTVRQRVAVHVVEGSKRCRRADEPASRFAEAE